MIETIILFAVIFLLIGIGRQSIWLITLTTFLILFGIFSLIWNKYIFQKLIIKRKWIYTRGFPGDRAVYKLFVNNDKILPVFWLKVQEKIFKTLIPENRSSITNSYDKDFYWINNIFSLGSFQKVERTQEIPLRERGIFNV